MNWWYEVIQKAAADGSLTPDINKTLGVTTPRAKGVLGTADQPSPDLDMPAPDNLESPLSPTDTANTLDGAPSMPDMGDAQTDPYNPIADRTPAVPPQESTLTPGTNGNLDVKDSYRQMFSKAGNFITQNPQYMLPVVAMALLGGGMAKKRRITGAAVGGVLGLLPAFMWAYYKHPNVQNYVKSLFNSNKVSI